MQPIYSNCVANGAGSPSDRMWIIQQSGRSRSRLSHVALRPGYPDRATAVRIKLRVSSLKGSFCKPRPKALDMGEAIYEPERLVRRCLDRERPFQGRGQIGILSQAFGLGCLNRPFRPKKCLADLS